MNITILRPYYLNGRTEFLKVGAVVADNAEQAIRGMSRRFNRTTAHPIEDGIVLGFPDGSRYQVHDEQLLPVT
jgi:hypothetical protein